MTGGAVQDHVIPAEPGYYLLTLWGDSFEDDPFVDATPIVAWDIRLTQTSEDCEDPPDADAVPVVAGWNGNDDRALRRHISRREPDYAVLAPNGRVENYSGDFFSSVEAWADSAMRNRIREAENATKDCVRQAAP